MATTNKRFVAKNGLDSNGNTITNVGASGNSLGISGAGDLTITISGTATLTVPSGSDTLATLTGTQTLTNKTLTTPIITEIDNATDITLDAGGDIILDADGADVLLKDNGVTFASFTQSGGELLIKSGATPTTALTLSGENVVVSGNLTVSGTTFTIDSNTVNIGDNIITLNSDETGTPSQDGGIEIERGTSANVSLLWDEANDKWTVGSQTFVAGTFEGSLSGNASTATTLQTARNINGVSFNGSSDITVPAAAGTLTGTTLASGVTASSLTSVGTLSSLSVTGDLTVDTDTLKVDSVNNRVGIGTATPNSQAKLEVAFDQNLSTLGQSRRLILNDLRGGVNERTEIGFGYQASSLQPAVIGFLTTDGATNTKGALYFATRDVTTASAPAERMRIDASGNVGIGVNPTNAKLEVVATSGEVFRADAAGGAYRIIANQTQVLLNGNVGIGVTSPSSKLVVSYGGYTNAGFALDIGADIGNNTSRTNATDKLGMMVVPHRTNAEEPLAVLYGYSYTAGSDVVIGGGVTAANAATQILFYTAANTTTVVGTERMRITAGGTLVVGAGIDSDGAVAGDIAVNPNSAKIGYIPLSANNRGYFEPYDGNGFVNIVSTFGTAGIRMLTRPSGGSITERVRVTADGNVGIGGTPTGYGAGYKELRLNADTIPIMDWAIGGTRILSIFATETQPVIKTVTNVPLVFGTNDAERMRIDGSGGYATLFMSAASGAPRNALTSTYWGYSTSYPVTMVGASSGTHTVSIGYDPIGNTNGAFTGDGREVLFRNGVQFVTPNAANNSFNLYHLILKDGKVGVNTTSPTTLLHVEGSSYSSMATLQPTYHGTKIFVYGPTASTSIDLPAQFPLMGLVTGNVWAVFGKYCGFLAGAAEAREFYISRNSSGTWSSAQFGPSAATGASLASVGGSGVNLEILTTTNSYFTLELTVMIR